ncbi:unnamed protein product [Rotaria sp. Silwood1]|nr:unnamed protein product [Rotaria sp. Silwood1]CAF3449137.1 unnamed protein product [Rotaria sp. Silwood1]CAF4889353.1 unnamed protein product [Rotaria sp. Silwood1]CAF4992267.1 unnamed protein product [Rotaria sp. Silwood1]
MSHGIRKENLNEWNNNNTNENTNLRQTVTDDVVNRPPRPPGPTLGPYLQFITTDLENMLWIGSVLIFQHVSYGRPTIEFIAQVKIAYDWEILYENLFNMRAYRINLNIELCQGYDDEKISWKIHWGNHSTNGSFYIAQYNQKWRGAFFSCNGFDATVSEETALNLTYNAVWNHMLPIHDKNPFHILLWGGDQVYNDFVFDDVPLLRNWSHLKFDQKWTWQFPNESKHEIAQYYFNNYTEHWERRPEMKKALGSIPSLMMWDDHDIFDGAGSYPPLLHDSPIMMGIFEIAQQMRLLFQHHTTPEKARKHQLFGYRSYNFLARCGPNLAILGADGRSERDHQTVTHAKTWDIIFEKLDHNLQNVQHLIVLFPVPFSFARFKIVENLLETWKKLAIKWRNIPFSEKTSSVFGLPEPYDDLLDEWTHKVHLGERNRILCRFQDIAHKKRTRITFFSGDVHCCGVSRFQTQGDNIPSPLHDSKLMYQIISSAIVNRPPPKIVTRVIHFFGTKWYPVADTEEELIDFFERDPEFRARLFLKKLLSNRNWCYFEQRAVTNSTLATRVTQTGFVENFFWPFIDSLLLLIGLCLGFSLLYKKSESAVTDQSYNKPLTASDQDNQIEQEANSIKVQFWLENMNLKKGRPHFTNYDLFIPDLK